jgi:hypothetical protein
MKAANIAAPEYIRPAYDAEPLFFECSVEQSYAGKNRKN